jgi:hypothetical protein
MTLSEGKGSREPTEFSHRVEQPEEVGKQGTAEESLPDLSTEEETPLVLNQEWEPATPLGSDFDEQLTAPDAETLRMMALHQALYESQGFELASWQGSEPFGPMGVKGYRVEQLSLPEGTRVDMEGREITVFMAMRVTLDGGPFPVGALPLMVWADDALLGVAQPSPDLSSVSAVTFDDSMLREGATFSISYGEDGPRTVLPRPLRFWRQELSQEKENP